MDSKIKASARRLIISAVLILIVPYNGRELFLESTDTVRAFGDREISCVIDTGNDMYSNKGLKAGFNYELLKRYAEATGREIRIRAARDGENNIDSLNYGIIDILVRQTADTIYSPLVRKSRNVDHYCAWYLRADRTAEMKDINLWLNSYIGTREYSEQRNRFYSLYDPFKRLLTGSLSDRISPYDSLIRKHSEILGWDWRMLAAVIYQESRFSINTFSECGAAGLMQVMPGTAEYYGITDLMDPEQNLIAGTMHLARIQKAYDGEEFSPEERINFTLAAYNAGERRIADCRLFASQKEMDSTKWDEIVKIIPEMRKYSFVYNDTVRSGRFRGTETISYVNRVRQIYDAFCEICPEA